MFRRSSGDVPANCRSASLPHQLLVCYIRFLVLAGLRRLAYMEILVRQPRSACIHICLRNGAIAADAVPFGIGRSARVRGARKHKIAEKAAAEWIISHVLDDAAAVSIGVRLVQRFRRRAWKPLQQQRPDGCIQTESMIASWVRTVYPYETGSRSKAARTRRPIKGLVEFRRDESGCFVMMS